MSSHADTIRGAFQTYPIPGDDAALAALDALLAENQRYERALERLRDTPPRAMRDYDSFVLDVSQKALAGDAE